VLRILNKQFDKVMTCGNTLIEMIEDDKVQIPLVQTVHAYHNERNRRNN